jgi:hypothetical protein
MKRRWLVYFTAIIALIGALPRAHCLCHNQEVLLIMASSDNCCHGHCPQAGRSVKGTDLSCFRSANTQALSGATWSTNLSETQIAPAYLPQVLMTLLSQHSDSIANAGRGPPFLRQYSLGLYLLHGVLLS